MADKHESESRLDDLTMTNICESEQRSDDIAMDEGSTAPLNESSDETVKGDNDKGKQKSVQTLEERRAAFENDVFVQKIHARPINGKYLLLRKLGRGAHARVYIARDRENGEEVALKLEHCRRIDPSILRGEVEIYKDFQGLPGFADFYWYGWHDDYRIMAFQLLGPSLRDLFVFCRHRFSLKTILMLVDQLLSRLETLHSRKIVHRDVKPENFMLGTGKNGNVVYIADFGLSQEVGRDYEPPRRPRLIGTPRFASIRSHKGQSQSFKDDLESLGYMLIYFLCGRLSWQGLEGRPRKVSERILRRKERKTAKQLCAGLPHEFAQYMEYVHQLKHAEEPDYAMLKELFRGRARQEDIENDNIYDWTIIRYKQMKHKEKQDC